MDNQLPLEEPLETDAFDELHLKIQADEKKESKSENGRVASSGANKIELNEITEDQPWNQESIVLLRRWYKECKNRSNAHNAKGLQFKKKHYGFSIPSVAFPIIMSGVVTSLNDSCSSPTVIGINAFSFIITGCLNGIIQICAFHNKYEEHMRYSNLYGELCDKMSLEISKPIQFRQGVDTFMTEITYAMNSLNLHAPDI
jgi:hypothetical protein